MVGLYLPENLFRECPCLQRGRKRALQQALGLPSQPCGGEAVAVAVAVWLTRKVGRRHRHSIGLCLGLGFNLILSTSTSLYLSLGVHRTHSDGFGDLPVSVDSEYHSGQSN